MADWAIGLWMRLRDGLLKQAGPGAEGVNGTLPRTRPQDCVAMLAGIHDEVVRAINHIASPEHATAVYWLEALQDGLPATITTDQWLTIGRPTDDGQVRKMPDPAKSGWIIDAMKAAGINVETGTLYRVAAGQAGNAPILGLASKSDRCYQLAAAFMKIAPQQPWLTAEQVKEWWKSLYALLLACSVALEIPTPGLYDRITGAIKYSAAETWKWTSETAAPAVAHAAGEALAGGAKIAGEALGEGVAGFAGSAGLTAWLFVLAAVALWIEVA